MDKGQVASLLQRLTTIDGPSGMEERVSALVEELAAPYIHETQRDAMGSTILIRRGERPDGAPERRLMIAAHEDEIGLMVSDVDRGFLRIVDANQYDARTLVAQEVTAYPSGSDAFPDGITGFIGSRPPHVLTPEERKEPAPITKMRVDLGLPSGPDQPALLDGKRLEELFRVGDRVVLRGPYTELMNGRVATKALDNRASVALMVAMLGHLATMRHTWDVYAVATSQEESGLRGAQTSAFRVNPDLAVALDVTFASTPGLDDTKTVDMDKGPAIAWGPNLHPALVQRLRSLADDHDISYVTEPTPAGTGTDAWAIQVARTGVPTALISVPIRYMHSVVEMLSPADVDRSARLLALFAAGLDETFLASLPEDV